MSDVVKGLLEGKKRRDGQTKKGKWVNFAFKVKGQWYGAFFNPEQDEGILTEADALAEGDEVELSEVVKEGKYLNFKSFKVLAKTARIAGSAGSSAPATAKDYTYHLRGCMHMVLEMAKIQADKDLLSDKILAPGFFEDYILETGIELARKVWETQYEPIEQAEKPAQDSLKE
jgi:hypothetical protein